eukprot:9503157-Pyramimonas_sp.AAC.2
MRHGVDGGVSPQPAARGSRACERRAGINASGPPCGQDSCPYPVPLGRFFGSGATRPRRTGYGYAPLTRFVARGPTE